MSIYKAFQPDWSKCRARALCWKEETELLVHEMKRSLKFIEWKKKWWQSLVVQRIGARPDIQAGLLAYVAKQVAVWEKVGKGFADIWVPLLDQWDK